VIEFEGVTKRFGGHCILEDFTLTIPEGQTTVLMGYSGTGKSVCLKHIVGLLVPDQGRVVVDGQVVSELDFEQLMQLRSRIGFVFQFAALLDSLTIAENIALGLRHQGLDAKTVVQRVSECLELVELPECSEQYPAQLSGGMRKRVGIARAIALRPRYILYDEPTTGLDPVTTADMNELMIRSRRELGATSVVVTHDVGSAFQIADRIAVLYRGKIRQCGTVAEIRGTSDPLVREFLAGHHAEHGGQR
jgi:phospholipid/cholesterol/gamma-HCH transport system ATP-binding protein